MRELWLKPTFPKVPRKVPRGFERAVLGATRVWSVFWAVCERLYLALTGCQGVDCFGRGRD
jgi:hypothetical protein